MVVPNQRFIKWFICVILRVREIHETHMCCKHTAQVNAFVSKPITLKSSHSVISSVTEFSVVSTTQTIFFRSCVLDRILYNGPCWMVISHLSPSMCAGTRNDIWALHKITLQSIATVPLSLLPQSSPTSTWLSLCTETIDVYAMGHCVVSSFFVHTFRHFCAIFG